MSSSPGLPTLDQLRLFVAVVDAGSFAAAGRRLGRATSVISYAVANLEAQLGVALFDRQSTHKPLLTEAGHAVLAEARRVTRDVEGLQAKVKGLLDGLEAEVNLAVDVMLPTARLVDALKAFQAAFPTVSLRLHVEALGAIAQLVLERTAAVGISGPLARQIKGIDRIGVGAVRMVPVAAPTHPLAMEPVPTPGIALHHVQLVLTDRSALTAGQDFGVLGTQTWRLADLGVKHALLIAGIGWGNMPEPMIEADLEAGRLVRLRVPGFLEPAYSFDAIHRTDTPPGPAGRWLIQHMAGQGN